MRARAFVGLAVVLALPAASLGRSIDRDIAKYAAITGTNRLAKDTEDAKGLLLLRLATKLRPKYDRALLPQAMLEKGMPLETTPTKVSEKKLIDVIVQRAEQLRAEEAPKDAGSAKLAMLYFRVAEAFRPTDKDVMLGIMKLRTDGIEHGLEELLETGVSIRADAQSRAERGETRSDRGPSRGGGGPSPRKPWTVPELGLELLPVSAGRFTMGDDGVFERSRPAHKVRLTKPFWIGKFEVLQTEYESVTGANPSGCTGKERLPVDSITWKEAMAFCAELTRIEKEAGRLPAGYVYRLPTEAEWEYSCRAGSNGTFSFGNNGGRLYRYGNYCDRTFEGTMPYKDDKHDDGHGRSAPAGSYRPNAWGLFDMHGNLYEWSLDYLPPYSKKPATDPVGSTTGRERMHRGGSWANDPSACSSHRRAPRDAEVKGITIGLRVVLAPEIRD